MIVNIQGKIVEALAPRSGVSKNGNEWVSQDFVIEDANGDKLVFNVFGKEKIESYGLATGIVTAVTVKIESKKWNDKWFTQATCTECITKQPAPQETVKPAVTVEPIPSQPTAVNIGTPIGVDNLPF